MRKNICLKVSADGLSLSVEGADLLVSVDRVNVVLLVEEVGLVADNDFLSVDFLFLFLLLYLSGGFDSLWRGSFDSLSIFL